MSQDVGQVSQNAPASTARSVAMAETTQVMQQETKSGTSFAARQAGSILIGTNYVAPRASVNQRLKHKKSGPLKEPA